MTAPMSRIIDHHLINILEEHATEPETLVILDLDDTVFTAEPGHVGNAWCKYMLMYGQNLGLSYKEAADIVIPEFIKRQELNRIRPVEATTVATIRQLQARKIPVVGLTARIITLKDYTIRDLASLGLDFSTSVPTPACLNLEVANFGAWHGGIGFCNDHYKDAILQHLLETTGYRPAKIVFVDDIERYIVKVQSVAERYNIPYVGIRYGHLDAVTAAYVLDETSKLIFHAPSTPTPQTQATTTI